MTSRDVVFREKEIYKETLKNTEKIGTKTTSSHLEFEVELLSNQTEVKVE